MRLLNGAVGAVCLSLALAASASAQMQVGIKGGWHRPSMGGADASGTEAMNTFGGGAFLSVGVSPMFALQPELNYARRGFAASVSGVDVKTKLDYLQVPVMVKLMIPMENSGLQPELMAGPYVGFKASCKATGTSGGVSASGDCGSSFKSTDFGASFGGGVQMKLAPKFNGLVEVRYDLGFAKISDASPQPDVKNRALYVSLGVSMPLGVK